MPPAGTPATGAARTGFLILACATPLGLFLAATLAGTSIGTAHLVWTTTQTYLAIPLAALIGWAALLFSRAAQLSRAARRPAPPTTEPDPPPAVAAAAEPPAPPDVVAPPPPPAFVPAPRVIPLQPDPPRTPRSAPPQNAAGNPYFPAPTPGRTR